MTDEETIEYVRDVIMSNLFRNGCERDGMAIMADETNKVLLAHIKGLKALFEKAEKILEEDSKNE